MAHFIRVQTAHIGDCAASKTMGLLEGESFRQFRPAEEVRVEAEPLLRDPEASEADRQWARMLLEENQQT